VGRDGSVHPLGGQTVMGARSMMYADAMVDISGSSDHGLGGTVVYQGEAVCPPSAYLWVSAPFPGTPPVAPRGRLAQLQRSMPMLRDLFAYRLYEALPHVRDVRA
jgi:hypothetical protein